MTTLPPPNAGPVDLLRPGTLLREWRIGRFIARGAFGQVFEARRVSWVADEPPRALKVFDPIMSSAARATLLSEFDVLRRMRHRNLLRGEDAFDVEDGPFTGCVVFVLELADADLAGEIAEHARLPPEQVASIGAQVAGGLAALHATGQLHGDVKPANLLRVGPDWKLGDFGVSVAVQGSYTVAPGATLDFTPPELSTERDGYRVHRSSDVWALGVTLWLAATGRHPFAGATPHTRLAAALRNDRAPAPIEPRLAELINRCCLVAEPRSRADAHDLAAQLAGLAHDLAGTTRNLRPAGPTRNQPPAGLRNDPAARRSEPGPGPAPLAADHPPRPAPTANPTAVPWPPAGPPHPGGSPPPRPEPVTAVVRAPAATGRAGGGWRAAGALGAGVAVTAGLLQLASLAAALAPLELGGRRALYLGLVVALLAGVGITVRRRGSAGQRRFALLGSLATMIVGTAYLFWGALLWPG